MFSSPWGIFKKMTFFFLSRLSFCWDSFLVQKKYFHGKRALIANTHYVKKADIAHKIPLCINFEFSRKKSGFDFFTTFFSQNGCFVWYKIEFCLSVLDGFGLLLFRKTSHWDSFFCSAILSGTKCRSLPMWQVFGTRKYSYLFNNSNFPPWFPIRQGKITCANWLYHPNFY